MGMAEGRMSMKSIILCALALCAGSARADITAVYHGPEGTPPMIIKLGADGSLKSDRGKGMVTILRDGHSFIIQNGQRGPNVFRVEDMKVAMAEQLAKAPPQVRAQIANAPGRVLVLQGTMTVGGWTGDAYYSRAADGTLSPAPFLVISHDPALAPLGRAIALQFEIGDQLMGSKPNTAVLNAMRAGTPLLMNGQALESISDAPVDPAEFALPAPVETLEQLRKRLGEG